MRGTWRRWSLLVAGMGSLAMGVETAQAAIEISVNQGGRNVIPLMATGVQNLELITHVTGVNGLADEGMKVIQGDLMSNGVGAGLGNLTFTALAPFTTNSSGGTMADLDSDGDFDLGTGAASAGTPPHIWARSGAMQVSPTPDVGHFIMGNIAWNVTTLGSGAGVGNEKTTTVTWRKNVGAFGVASVGYNSDGGANETGSSPGLTIVGATFYRPYAVTDVKAGDAGDQYVVTDVTAGLTLSGAGAQSEYGEGGSTGAAFAWDLDNDGLFDDASIPSPVLDAATLAGLGEGLHTIRLRVAARDNGSELAVTQVAEGTILILPEPATLGLAVAGGVVLLGRRRRR